MAAVEVTISGMLYDKVNRTTQNVVLIGEATLTGIGVGGGPIVPPVQPPGGGGSYPPHPSHPIVMPGEPSHPIVLPGDPSWPKPPELPPPGSVPPNSGIVIYKDAEGNLSWMKFVPGGRPPTEPDPKG